jgi:hypothetical protein
MQGIQYGDVNMGQQSKDWTSAPRWMNVQWCRFELCVGGLTSALIISLWSSIFSLSILWQSWSFKSFISSCRVTCNYKPLRVRQLRLSHITESYSSSNLLNHWRMLDWQHSTFLVHMHVCTCLSVRLLLDSSPFKSGDSIFLLVAALLASQIESTDVSVCWIYFHLSSRDG